MFELYTENARQAIYFARSEASLLGSPFIETEHFLLGLLQESDGLARRLLASVDVEAIRHEIHQGAPVQDLVPGSADLPLSLVMKRVLARAAEDASAIGHRHIGAEHLLLGLLGETSCPAARILQKYGIDRERVWREVAEARPGVARAVTTGGEDTPGRDRLHALVNSLPHGALEHARNILQDLQTWPPQPPEEIARIRELMEQHMKQALPPGARMDRGGGGSWSTDTKGEIQDGYFSATRVEDGAAVFETHRFHRGHEITVLERLRLSDDGKTLAYSLEIHGPKQEQRYAIDFVVS